MASVIVISGPSGSGKSTLLKKLFAEFAGRFEFGVSHTTRNPRVGETEGKDYFFVDKRTFEKMVKDGDFLEHAQFSGNRYGTSKMAVERVIKSGKMCVLDVEVNGVKNIKRTNLAARYIFIRAPDMEELERRLRGRGTESEESIKTRLESCREAFDYSNQSGSYDSVVINDDLEDSYSKLKNVIFS